MFWGSVWNILTIYKLSVFISKYKPAKVHRFFVFDYDKSSNIEVRIKLIYFPESEPELKRKLVNYCKYILESKFLVKDLIEVGLWGQQ